ncbi:hypothetical protein Q7469_12460 [Glaesserella parasuis]|uniref:Uncharacterized protein n=1 Tax=Glaesserella parasuis TaxID=738 RepID=A0A6M8SWH9_GLAPU|nr:hypothetical protein [Glaesserella parasuis]MDD2169126.1 hypothetical protein [Glaesserella parasuis]MDD2172073.1 hypothetical protein [Glaesserella parasuis]MDG6310852.1 hypothetical protein [Glaesserella parasuis]MDG6347004.1 hypothetical protein [Glaesserella parasuis]MDG6410011.1 hypothetical protein [Glaesserella parasuis]
MQKQYRTKAKSVVVSGVLIKDDNIKRIINSGSTKLIESVTEEDEGK